MIAPPSAPSTLDRFDVRVSTAAGGSLRQLSEATILDAADVHTAITLARLVGGADEAVQVAVALAVRAVRLGHVFVDLPTVASTAAPEDDGVDLSALPWPDPATWPALIAASPLTATGPDGHINRPLRLIGTRLYLDRYWRHEQTVVHDLLQRTSGPQPTVDADALAAGLRRLFPPDSDSEAGDNLQLLAAASAVLRRFAVVAGGPGTGKTTTVARIVALLHEQAHALDEPEPRVALAAPTGKAAARLAESVHFEAATLDVDPTVRAALLATQASTIHRLLGWQPGNRSRFRHDATNQLAHNVVIIDESSMVSLSLMAKLLAAVRPTARTILVGDPRQLTSVEAGAVLGDIVGPASGGLRLRPVARSALAVIVGSPVRAVDPGPDTSIGDGIVVLRRVHRFGGGIAATAKALESGDADAVIDALSSSGQDVTWIDVTGLDPRTSPELARVRDAIVDTARSVVAAARVGDGREALNRLQATQVLCAHREGQAGASRWRTEIERWLRSAIPGYGGGIWFAGRPLLITENDYGLGVFNGDTGVVIDAGNRLRAVFDRRGELLQVRPNRLVAVESLYAMTIHKAQGSQFGAVIVVLPDTISPLVTRELLYTAITRGQAHLTLVASEAVVRAAVIRPVARASGLADALWPASRQAIRPAPAGDPARPGGHGVA